MKTKPTEWVRLRCLAVELITKRWAGKEFSATEFGQWVRDTRRANREEGGLLWHLWNGRDAMKKEGLLKHVSGEGRATIWRMP